MTEIQVFTLHRFFKVMRKLRIIGVVHTKVTKEHVTEFGRPDRYAMQITRYEAGIYVTHEERFFQILDGLGIALHESCSHDTQLLR